VSPSRHGRSLVVTLIAAAGLSACGGGADSGDPADNEPAEAAGTHAVDQTICRAEATAVPDASGAGFPAAWEFPPRTTVYDREDREGVGVILTAVSQTPFDQILDFLNEDMVAAGFKVTSGETEENDAEADWTSEDSSGRWTIRKSGTCPGETVLQVFAAES
jgi:hypothetical protein